MCLTPDPSLGDKPRSLGAACLTLSCGLCLQVVPSGASAGCSGVERHGDGRRGDEGSSKSGQEAGGGSAPPMPVRAQGQALLIGVTPGMCLNFSLCAGVKWQYPLPSRNRWLKLSQHQLGTDRTIALAPTSTTSRRTGASHSSSQITDTSLLITVFTLTPKEPRLRNTAVMSARFVLITSAIARRATLYLLDKMHAQSPSK